MFDLMEEGSGSRENRIEGIVLGIVTNNQDELRLGRVKIKFPWSGEGDETQWARVVTFMAGKEMGAFFLPEVGDEVIVAFDHGDMNHPYVLGALWNGKSKPPSTNDDGQNNIRMLKSRSGHVITFNDGEGAEKVEVRTKSGHTILLDESPGKENITIKDKSGNNYIEIDSVQNAITIQSGTKLILKAKDMELASDGRLSIKAKGDLTIKGAVVKIN